MDGIANVARQQQSQVGAAEVQGRVQEQSQQVQHTAQTRTKQADVTKEMQAAAIDNAKKWIQKRALKIW